VFANRAGKPIDRRNLLNRQIKPTAKKLGLPKEIDFRSFRTMHSSWMLRTAARPEVTGDNMRHAKIDVTQNVYGAQLGGRTGGGGHADHRRSVSHAIGVP
jgi:integrase